jgi:hypothetical protein
VRPRAISSAIASCVSFAAPESIAACSSAW